MAKRTMTDVWRDMMNLSGFDVEDDHATADGLLCEALKLVAPDSEQVKAIVEKYESLSKWYA